MNKRGEFRTERDHRGEVQIPADSLWGIRTQRCLDVGNVSGEAAHPKTIDALILVKKASAAANADIGLLSPSISRLIQQSADEILAGQWREHFVIDPLHAGFARALNLNADEVLANRALCISGEAVGSYSVIDPDKHVSMSQSANDVFLSVMRLSILLALKDLQPVLLDLERLLRRKALEFDKIAKVGREHLQDSLPVTLGQEFNAYGSSVERSCRRLMESSQSLLELNLGGGEVGSGINVHPEFVPKVIAWLGQLTGMPFRGSEDYFRIAQSMADFVELSSSLKELAIELVKMGSDLCLLGSGPKAGIGEIKLPAILAEPLSLLPGIGSDQAQPVLPQSLTLAAFQVMGYEMATTLAAQAGQLELNSMMPLIGHNILKSMDLLRNSISSFNQHCASGISADQARCRELLELTPAAGVLLSGSLGPERAKRLLEEAVASGKTVRQLVIEQGLMSEQELNRVLNFKSMTQSGFVAGINSDTN